MSGSLKSVCILDQSIYEFDPRVRRKAEALVAAGYSVDVLALGSPRAKKTFELNGVNVRTISLVKKRASLGRYTFEYLAFFVWCFARVCIQMRKRKYAVIDVNTLPDFLIFAPIVARWMGAKLVLDMHEITPEFYISKYRIAENSWFVRLLKYIEKISFNFADRVITISDPIQDLLVGRGMSPAKTTVIMNAADEARFISGQQSSQVTKDTARGRFVMMYHGTLTWIYGLEIAVEAFALARERMPEAEFWILGFGPEESSLERLIQQSGLTSSVRLIGAIPPAEIPGWLKQCDVGILPIRRDVFLDFAFPNKLAEYIITGKPVIISRLKALCHYFSEEALAYFEPGNSQDLATEMVRIYRDTGLRDRLVARAKQEYMPIRWDVMKQRYLTLIDDLVACRALEQRRASGETVFVR